MGTCLNRGNRDKLTLSEYICIHKTEAMRVAGFTIIRNAIQYDYPVLESIRSVLPICDVFYIGLGASEDETAKYLTQLNSSKIRIINSIWDDTLREGGRVLAEETNKVFRQIPGEYDWVFYIQADEVIHERDHSVIVDAMHEYLGNTQVEGLLFRYKHFYGSYHFIAESPKWYRHEIRVIRNTKTIFSYRDAQGFRKEPNQKLRVKSIDAAVYHYGWVKDPIKMQKKYSDFQKLWHDDQWIEQNIVDKQQFEYDRHIESLIPYEDSHPKVMLPRIEKQTWSFDFDPAFTHYTMKNRFRNWVERWTGYRLWEYKNYKKI